MKEFPSLLKLRKKKETHRETGGIQRDDRRKEKGQIRVKILSHFVSEDLILPVFLLMAFSREMKTYGEHVFLTRTITHAQNMVLLGHYDSDLFLSSKPLFQNHT